MRVPATIKETKGSKILSIGYKEEGELTDLDYILFHLFMFLLFSITVIVIVLITVIVIVYFSL